MIILRNQMNIEKRNLYLFKTYFHRVICISSKCNSSRIPIWNDENNINLLFFLSDSHDLRVHLFNNKLKDDGPHLVMKNYDIALLTEKYPFDTMETNDDSSNYVFVQISLDNSLFSSIQSDSSGSFYDKYDKFCRKLDKSNGCIRKTSSLDFFNKNIVGKRLMNNNDTLINKKRSGFYKIDDGLKNSMSLRLLRFEEMVKNIDHTWLIKKKVLRDEENKRKLTNEDTTSKSGNSESNNNDLS